MTVPVYVGMPERDRTFRVPKAGEGYWGEIRCGGTCRDDYGRIVVWHDGAGRIVVLQRAAMESFQAALDACRFTIRLTGSHRSCDLQRRLYLSDPRRFASPDDTAHCRGLAIDVDQGMEPYRLRRVHDELSSRAWHQNRPDDEPWHYSMGIKV